jgi:hypothetical protein
MVVAPWPRSFISRNGASGRTMRVETSCEKSSSFLPASACRLEAPWAPVAPWRTRRTTAPSRAAPGSAGRVEKAAAPREKVARAAPPDREPEARRERAAPERAEKRAAAAPPREAEERLPEARGRQAAAEPPVDPPARPDRPVPPRVQQERAEQPAHPGPPAREARRAERAERGVPQARPDHRRRDPAARRARAQARAEPAGRYHR